MFNKFTVRQICVFALFLHVLSPLAIVSIYADEPETPKPREDIFLAPLAEAVYYGRTSPAIGYGIALGYGTGSVFGIRGMFAQSLEEERQVISLEILLLLRFYFFGLKAFSGPFIQLNAGPCVYFKDTSLFFPAKIGSISAGLIAGWRFLIGKNFFIEPYVRGGYPYYGGAGLSAGVRF